MASESDSMSRTATKFALQTDKRDIKDLWNDALKDYQNTVGKSLRIKFSNTDDMLQYGMEQKDTFSKWRHDGKKLDKIRALFMQSIDYIELGTQKLLAAATPAFPPAAAISTALTFVLNACKGQSADYDMVACFFEDMNGFLQRVTILEGRLPEYRAYQACLMDVFTSFLMMCAFATKFISKGRLKTWIINSIKGQDADLSSARKRMDKNIKTLESATEIAILANTEGLKGGQRGLHLMQEELRENQTKQYELAQEQSRMLEEVQKSQVAVQEGVNTLQTDVQAILALMKQGSNNSAASANEHSGNDSNKVSTGIPTNVENGAKLRKSLRTRVAGTGEWLFQTAAWKSWLTSLDTNILLVQGPPGIGKTYLAAAAYNHLHQVAGADPERHSVVTCFFCDDDVDRLQTFGSFMNSVVLQISDQNSVLRDRFGQKLNKDREVQEWNWSISDRYWQELFVPSFGKDSKYRLHIVVDSADELEAHAADDCFINMVNKMNELELNVKVLLTVRSVPSEASRSPLQPRFQGLNNMLTLALSKDDVQTDIKMLIADRIQVNDKTQGSLAHLKSKTQHKIAAQIEEKADTLLYVDLAFRYLSGIGREGAIVRELETGLSQETVALFEGILKKCKRHLPHDLEAPVQLLLIWLTYSFDLLDLDQANQLAQLSSQYEHVRVEEEIEYAFGRIIQIGPLTKTSDGSSELNLEKMLEDATFTDSVHDDGNLLVSLRDQSMKELLRNTDITSWGNQSATTNGQSVHKPVDTSSTSHRTIFLLCCEILRYQQDNKTSTSTSSGAQKLRQYASKYCLRHWQNIDCDRHEVSENIEVCNAFYNLLRNRHGFAAAFEPNNMELENVVKMAYTMSTETGFETFMEQWQRWARFVQEATTSLAPSEHEPTQKKHVEMESYWTGWENPFDRAFVPLFEAHMENWLNGWTDRNSVLGSHRRALELYTAMSESNPPIPSAVDEYWEIWKFSDERRAWGHLPDDAKNVYTVRTSWRHPLTSTAHFATAIVLEEHSAKEASYRELQVAAEKCSDTGQKAWIYIELSRVRRKFSLVAGVDDDNDNLTEEKHASRRDDYKQALDHLDFALGLISDTTSLVRLTALVEKIDLLQDLKKLLHDETIDNEIAENFRGLRSSSSVWIVDNVNILSKEIEFLSRNHTQVINLFTGLTPIQRFSAVMALRRPLNSILLPAAVVTKRTPELQEFYYEILETLNLGGCGIIWYTTLANYLCRGIKDLQLASNALKQASSHVFTDWYVDIKYRRYDADYISEAWLNLASDVIHQQLRSSNTLDAKLALLQEAEALPLQPIVQSVQMNTTSMLPYLVVLARMQKRMGLLYKYQATLQQAFDICWDNLHDNFAANDSKTLRYLSKILAIGPGFSREAEIISSAQLYNLGNTPISKGTDTRQVSEVKESTESIEYDYIQYNTWSVLQEPPVQCPNDEAGHKCPNSMRWSTWTGPMYTCLCCTNSFLCQDCHDERIKRNTSGEVEGRVDFCCDGGDYLKTPVAGWKGIKYGVVYVENEKPTVFNEFLDQLREKWKQAWEDFWKG